MVTAEGAASHEAARDGEGVVTVLAGGVGLIANIQPVLGCPARTARRAAFPDDVDPSPSRMARPDA